MKAALPSVGDLIAGRYRLTRELGRGGYGVVFHARQETIRRNVAIKFLDPEVARDALEVERFRREVYNVSGLTHANTITVYDYGQTPAGLLYIVMEYLEGANLRDWLNRRRKLSYDEVFAVVCQILASLREAHQHGIVHRDLKLENMFLQRPESGEVFVKVLDFGLSKNVSSTRTLEGVPGAPMTADGIICGTPQYMSPEHAYGEPVGPPSDVYSVGLVAWELLTGKTAFDGQSPVEILLKQVNEPTPELPASLRMTDLAEFIRIATRKEASERFADAGAALDWLRAPRRGSVEPAYPVSRQMDSRNPDLESAAVGHATLRAELAIDAHALHADALIEPATEATVVAPTADDVPALSAPAAVGPAPAAPLRYTELDMQLAQLPLVGRERELEELLSWRQSALTSGGVLWLSGAPGAGKTRLLEEWIDRVRQTDNVQILHGRHRPGGLALEGLREALATVVRPRHGSGQRRDPFAPASALSTSEIAELQALLQIPADVTPPPISGGAPSSSLSLPELPTIDHLARGRDWACARLEASLVSLARNTPTLLVLEDVQWADSFTLRLVEHLQEDVEARRAPLAIVLTWRDEDDLDRAPINRLSWAVRHLALGPLRDADARGLLEFVLPPSQGLVEHVLTLGRGNPLHLIQIARHLVDRQIISYDAGRQVWTLDTPDLSAAELLPPDLEGLVHERIERLLASDATGGSGELGALLVRAALIGSCFTRAMLHELVVREGCPALQSAAAPGVLDAHLSTLLDAGVLAATARDDADGPRYEFAHHARRAALERARELAPDERAALHRLIATLKIERYRDGGAGPDRTGPDHSGPDHSGLAASPPGLIDEIAHEIARHYLDAGDRGTSAEWWVRAARYAERAHDFASALARYRQAEQLGDASPDAHDRDRLDMHLAQGRLHRYLGDYGPAEDALRNARTAAQHLGDLAAEARASEALADVLALLGRFDEARRLYRQVIGWYDELPDPAGRLRCDLGLADIARFRGNYLEAEVIFERAAHRARTLGDPTLEIQCLLGLGRCAYVAGRLHQAAHLFDDARQRAERLDHALLLDAAEIELGCVAIFTEGLACSEALVRGVLQRSRKLGDMLGQAQAHLILALGLRRSTRLEAAEMHAERARLLFERLSHHHGIAKCILLRAELAWVRGQLETALRRVHDSRKLHRDLGDHHGLALSMMFQGLFECETGQIEHARLTLGEAMTIGGREGLGLYESHCLLFMGMTYEAEGNTEEAIAYYGESLQVAERHGNREMASFAAISLAKLHMVMGDLGAARHEVPLAIAQADTLGHSYATTFALIGQAWLARLSGDAPRLQSALQRLRVLHNVPDGPQMRIPRRLLELGHLTARHQPIERATPSLLALAELLRALDAPGLADELRALAGA